MIPIKDNDIYIYIYIYIYIISIIMNYKNNIWLNSSIWLVIGTVIVITNPRQSEPWSNGKKSNF